MTSRYGKDAGHKMNLVNSQIERKTDLLLRQDLCGPEAQETQPGTAETPSEPRKRLFIAERTPHKSRKTKDENSDLLGTNFPGRAMLLNLKENNPSSFLNV